MPADRVAVFARSGRLGRFINLVLARHPGCRLRSGRAPGVVPGAPDRRRGGHPHPTASSPSATAPTGSWSWWSSATEVGASTHERTEEAADLIAAAFLRVTSRANFVSGLQAESRTDPLTGLANRRTLYERIEIEMEHALRSDTPADRGHDRPRPLQAVQRPVRPRGRRHAAAVRSPRSWCPTSGARTWWSRYGGEEFCLVLPDTDLVGGHHLLDKLREGGRDATTDFGVTLSAGLTSWDGIEDPTSFIERADQALYRAKESGRNRVVSIQPSPSLTGCRRPRVGRSRPGSVIGRTSRTR